MTSALLALALAVADPIGFPPPAAPSPVAAAPAPPAAAAIAATPPPAPVALPALAGPSAAALPALALLVLAAAIALVLRRRRAVPRLVTVLETTSLGPRRALVVARLGDELLVLGASEGGIALLASRPAPTRPLPTGLAPEPEAEDAPPTGGRVASLLARLRAPAHAPRPGEGPAFDTFLEESAEDVELRRKLARGQAGSVR